MIQTWSLQDGRQSLVLAAEREHLPEVIYWGPRLPDGEDLDVLARAHQMDVTGGMLDQNPELSICPEATRTFPGQPGMILRAGDGTPLLPKFCFEKATKEENSLTLSYRDQSNTLTYRAHFAINPTSHMITARAEIESGAPVHLHWLSAPVFPAPQNSDDVIDFSGRWCGEFQMNRTPWSAGMRYRENRTGRTGHEHFPGLIVPCHGATNTRGHAYGFHYGWSGGHRMIAEELPDGRRQIQFGDAARIEHTPQCKFTSAPLYAMFSDDGINGCAVSFQRHLRDEIVQFPHPDQPRPVHYNCWEAVYFNHNLPELKEIADRAATLGAERFVLDDGWFGNRDDDTRALSDWEVDRRKYPDGLDPLIEHVHGLGMSFGIWFEPEMINPDSDIHRAHPDWALGGEDQILGRQQKALNMALPDVQDFLFDRISAVLSAHEIDYIKWDHNRVLPMPDAAQTRGSYALIDRLRAAFAHVEIESCASGGGRIDFGILERTQRVWLSDSNDALERLRIQHNAAIFLPSVVTGSHVGPRHCHTSGRVIDIRMRAWVAAQRHMGFEMDPRELTDDEAEVLTRTTKWWKDNRNWMARADILRLDSADPSVIAEQQLSETGDHFVVFAGVADTSRQIAPRPLRLTRLSPDVMYRVDLVNRDDAPALSRGAPALKSSPLELSGQYLMNHGLMLPWQFPLHMWVIEGTKI
ncbi:alpha-galactosidase [Aliiroseovarius lamellibrachiae]|uniref:alpha-galactosidase n=1 Tax=Aliiroseovarius lamellibrachiae TaxID=1924933 RepID=UPI001BE00305|nr:alpha-galactosidase [Aliiroseovarius lamellibrachiae]MBT2132421.1 alpha-galactosidase [Aliiroseovarius lamellibrachiae]